MQGTHGVGGSGAIHVPLVLNGTLKCGEPVSVLLNVRIAGRHAHVVHEDGELAKTEGIHFLKFAHASNFSIMRSITLSSLPVKATPGWMAQMKFTLVA